MALLIHLSATYSTNDYVKQLLLNGPLEEGSIVYTDFQSTGKGQRGNSWESEKGKNLLFSIVLYPTMIAADKQFIISQFTSLAIKEVLSLYTDNITIKWPNDIYWQEKKICGILVENNLMGGQISQSVIGIGINLNQITFESDALNPVSLKQITGIEYSIEEILHAIHEKIILYYQEILVGKEKEITTQYKSSLFRKEGYHWYHDKNSQFKARLLDIEDSGLLVLETEDKQIRKFAFKEISYILQS